MLAQTIAQHVANMTGVTPAEIYGRSHRRRQALARHVVWFTLARKYSWDYSAIAREFNRERASVMRAIYSIEDQTVLLRDVRELVRAVEATDYYAHIGVVVAKCSGPNP